VRGDATRLQNLLIKLGLNACDAIDTEGTITMRVGFAEQHSAPAELGTNRFVYIGVHDTGSGIANKDVGHVFEPFFTTKDFGQGTGLGLAAAYGAAKAHGGAITVRSHPGDTEFLLYLPRAEGAVPVRNELASGSPLVADGTTKALIVDDEAGVRQVLARLLQNLGYAVETCESGDLGVEVFCARPKEFQLVVLDMMMPGMSGAEVLTVLREMDPLVPVIMVTGHSFADFPSQDANTRTLTTPPPATSCANVYICSARVEAKPVSMTRRKVPSDSQLPITV
jgi:CheY-like chemotaxis protein